MGKRWQRILLGVGGLLLVLYFALSWYRYHYSMEVVEGFEVNMPELEQRLLIATQGSPFKKAVVTGLVEQLRQRPIYIKVIDVSLLAAVNEADWTALVLLHTWESWRPPLVVKHFLRRINVPEKVVVLTTSGSGEEKIEGVDAITASSEMEAVPVVVEGVMGRLNPLLR